MTFPTLELPLLLRNVAYKKEAVFVLGGWHCKSVLPSPSHLFFVHRVAQVP